MKTCPLCETSYPSRHTNCPIDGALLLESLDLEPGTVIRGKYRILRTLGHGGMGTVYLAEHILLGRQLALKFLSQELAQDPEFLPRFHREAHGIFELRHPNVVEVKDLDQAEDGTPFLVREYIAGPDLRHVLLHAEEGPDSERGEGINPRNEPIESIDALVPERCFSVPRALAIARGLAHGLAAAHAKGIIHRDIKPEDILLASAVGAPETPKLLDFGIAILRKTAAAIRGIHGPVLSPKYAAPEQWRGMPLEDLDTRTDLYALGGVLYEMLTGQTAFNAQNLEGWKHQHLNEEPQPPSLLRPELANWQGLDSLVLRLLAKDREQRPQDAGELVALLDAVLCIDPQLPAVAQREKAGFGWILEPAERSRRHSFLVWAAGVAVVIAAVFAAPRIWGPNLQSKYRLQQLSKSESAMVKGASVVPASKGLNGGADKRVASIAAQSGIPEGAAAQRHSIAEIEQRAEALDNQQRYAEAMALYGQACSAGSGAACMNIGVLYEDGHGVAKNFLRAASLYSEACTKGSAEACNLLGFMCETGVFGVARDYPQAMALYSRSCNAGNPNGCEGLGTIYRFGEGVPKDERKAEMFDLEACNMGSAGSCVTAAESLEKGGSFSEARRLYQKACSMGAKYACSMAEELPDAPQ